MPVHHRLGLRFIDDDLHRALRLRAAVQNSTIERVAIDALRQEFAQEIAHVRASDQEVSRQEEMHKKPNSSGKP